MPPRAARMLYVAAIMASLWIQQPVPLAVTAFVPIVALPALGISTASRVAGSYMGDANALFLAGFMIAAAVERCGLHRRLALVVLVHSAGNPGRLMLGFMGTTALLSAFMSNTATAAMQVPLAEGVIKRMRRAARQKLDSELAAPARPALELQEVESHLPPGSGAGDSGISPDARSRDEPGHADGQNGRQAPKARSPPEPSLAPEQAPRSPGVGARGSLEDAERDIETFARALMLAIAYSASLGGISTLTGTGPNIVFSGQFAALFPEAPPVSFAQWTVFALPISLGLLLLAWCMFWATRRFCGGSGRARAMHVDTASLRAELRALGPLSRAEVSVTAVLALTFALWLTRSPGFARGWEDLFEPKYVSDTTVAIFALLLLFVLPGDEPEGARAGAHQDAAARVDVGGDPADRADARPERRPSDGAPSLAEHSAPPPPPLRLLDWKTANGIPWNIVLLLGGGFAVANGFVDSGLSTVMACSLLGGSAVASLPPAPLALLLTGVVTLFTELCSNVATSTIVLPIVATIAQAMGVDPRLLMIPTTLACSLAFMLPVSTPPNAIAFATGHLRVQNMVIPGAVLNIAGTLCIVGAMFTYGTALFGMEASGGLPPWAVVRGGSDGGDAGGSTMAACGAAG